MADSVTNGALTRRRMLLGTGAALALPALLPRAARAAPAGTLRLGVLPFGTVQWELDTIRRFGLDKAAGLTIQPVELASPPAGQVALQGGSVDVITNDWLWVARQRATGTNLAFLPYTASLGAVIVPGNSPLKTLADLKGRRIGVAGSALDKSWLMLQAHAKQAHGLDLATAAEPVYAAPPLLSQQLEAGRIDAALTYWHFAAKLEAKGMRQLAGMDEVTRGLGVTTDVPMVGYCFKEDWARANSATVAAFSDCSRQAKEILRKDDSAWAPLRPLMGADSDAAALRLRDRFREGIPAKWGEPERKDAATLFALLAKLGGPELVGTATSIPEGTFWPLAWG